ncbi:MAG: response regulator [Candidatus Abyssobacteria bacterium SURF_5]|jgi:DNA-binding NtrC family response regulator|uniref:Response regulator n=1 Tax=Abyssobacteria bacterium (strain SURF_5) TaxID=2093360 RepID=A0A3A4NFP9_ABYX5|nr:MAG: response regulator [Candidatus Abyssubacteria bacterium SURF_5]
MNSINLLLVDDEEQFLSTAKRLMEKRGVSTFVCTNGFDAIRILKERRIDVVLLDLKMPGINGVEVLRKIKQNHPDIEVILLTGHASVESAVEGLKLGAFDYLMKPSTIPDILDKVRDAYERKVAKEEKARKSKVENIIRHPMAVFDKEEE